ncbi:MAG: type II toxin-antitoxin system mRNA interferase toxin, RelE/StbE family [Nitrospirae bacterium]|nr:type II toxin-antitoxin system mRNA interferase toxin, RelE/StbE family [Nitrospirota bacterium]
MYRLFTPKQFRRTVSRLIKKSPDLDPKLSKIIEILKNDPFAPMLKTHKLKGGMEELYACSLTYELRIVFELADNCITLLDIGSHDEVY